MIIRLEDCSEAIQNVIKERAGQENERTGYDMELGQLVRQTDYCYYYYMSRKIDYGDYTVEIRNQGDCGIDMNLWSPEKMYAYEITISANYKYEPYIVDMSYRISELMTDLNRYGELPSWETLKNFFESDVIKQLFAKHREVYEQLVTTVREDIEGEK